MDAGGFSNVKSSWPNYPKERLAVLLGLDRLVAVGVDAINTSFGYYNEDFDDKEPIQIATRTAAHMGIPVVVAAGNQGPREDSLQVLARAPWVISVGATDNKGRLLRKSSRGNRSGSGPTLVSTGTLLNQRNGSFWRFIDTFLPKQGGTSFSAPRVSPIAAVTKRCLEIMNSNFIEFQTGDWKKIPTRVSLITIGIADSGPVLEKIPTSPYAEQMWQEGSIKLFSRSTREYNWYSTIANFLEKTGIEFHPNVNISVIKNALHQMARTLPNYQEYEVGSGYVDVSDCKSFFSTMLPSKWIQLFSSVDILDNYKNELKSLDENLGPLWESQIALSLIDMLLGSLRIWFVRIIGTNRELHDL